MKPWPQHERFAHVVASLRELLADGGLVGQTIILSGPDVHTTRLLEALAWVTHPIPFTHLHWTPPATPGPGTGVAAIVEKARAVLERRDGYIVITTEHPDKMPVDVRRRALHYDIAS